MGNTKLILGLDLGVRSVGWALMRGKTGTPKEIVRLGVRVFEAGMEGEIEQGREESRNKKRRDMRMQRRQADRRRRRHKRLAALLQKAGLLPPGDLQSARGRHDFFQKMDQGIYARYAEGVPTEDRHRFANTVPYWLRARALDTPLELHELGRALYHLGQRRGFLSNRRAPRENEDDSVVYQGIAELHEFIETTGCETLGQYFATLDPTDIEGQRIRVRWTHRNMYQHEFERIWASQAPHHPKVLTEDLREQIGRVLFYQRPLKVQKHLIGKCQFECKARGAKYDRRRAPWALPAAQRFRMLQKVNDLEIEYPDFRRRPLEPAERAALLDMLEQEGTLKFTAVRKRLKLKGTTFNLERGGEPKIPGNTTVAKLRRVLGDRWDAYPEADRAALVEDLMSFEKEEALARRAEKRWGMDPDTAKNFADIKLDQDYGNLSRQALKKLLPLMEQGIPYMTAARQVYGAFDEVDSVEEELPPVAQGLPEELRNPTVLRVLVEMRRVVNSVIRQYGKPDKIRIELARDMKKSKKQRKKISARNRVQQKARENAKKRILQETGDEHPSRGDVERVLLAEECGWECPYTGKSINMASLLGQAAQFDVEHIIPFSRSLDNSFLNKTLCYHEENRSVKRNRTPFEAYAGNDDRWEEILGRVKRFRGDARDIKLERFQMHDEVLDAFLEGFTSAQLNDTRYASRLAAQFCGLLYGKDFRKHIQVSSGGITAELRKAWKLNDILGDGGLKTRDDHRHHAVDAIAIALAAPAMVKRITQMAQQAEQAGHRRWWNFIEPPWENFLQHAIHAVEEIRVSHRPERKANGALHKETLYSLQTYTGEDGSECLHLRKKLEDLSANEIDTIVDPKVRQIVRDQLDALGGDLRQFKEAAKHPFFCTSDGRRIPVHKVRVRQRYGTIAVGHAERQRRVRPAANHHLLIRALTDKEGQDKKWIGEVVNRYEAMRRRATKQALIQRSCEPGMRFVCSLAPGDIIQLDTDSGNRDTYVVRTVYETGVDKANVEFVALNDARKKVDIKAAKSWFKKSLPQLRKLGLQKVEVTPLGEVRRAND